MLILCAWTQNEESQLRHPLCVFRATVALAIKLRILEPIGYFIGLIRTDNKFGRHLLLCKCAPVQMLPKFL
jgi:hypothetical protein